ncbi:MAG: NAD-dependent epimerase/dehydratase family protein [bacterium]
MKALVTGARGFIGSFLVEQLLASGVEVHCLLRGTTSANVWISGLTCKRITGDITEPATLPQAVSQVDYVYHLAGCTKAVNRRQYEQINADGTRNLLAATLAQNPAVKRFVLVSSLAAAGPSLNGEPLTEEDQPHPVSSYGRSKLRAEKIALDYANKLPITIIRPPGVYGPRDRDVYRYFKYARQGMRPVLSGGARSTSFIYVKDLARGIILASEVSAAIGQTYFLCDDEPYTWEELGAAIASALDVQTRKLLLPVFLALPVAAIADLTARIRNRPSIINLDKYKELKMSHWICSNDKAKKELGFNTGFTLEEGIKETAEWYVENEWL